MTVPGIQRCGSSARRVAATGPACSRRFRPRSAKGFNVRVRSSTIVRAENCMVTIPEVLNQALGYHQAGDLQSAEQLYRQILQVDPQCTDAWHLLGVLAHQMGQNGLASDCVNRAITLNPTVP